MNTYIAVDIGGTKMRAALFPDSGIEAIRIEKIKTSGKTKTTLERLFSLIESVWPENGKVLSMGVAVPGYLNPQTGIVFSTPNIPAWKNLRLLRLLEEKFETTIRLENDANLAALGEWKYGAGQGVNNLVYLTISTGIGGGIIINNNLISGAGGLAGEFGHITILPDGPICSCGQLGHLEALSSGTAIAKYVEEKLAQGVVSTIKPNSELTAYEVSLAAQADDSLAQEAQERAVKYLGLAIANFIHIFNPSMIVLGGGVLNFGKKFMEQIQKAVERSVISNEYIKDLKITRAKLGDNSGLMGALALAHTSSTMLDN